MRDVERHPFTSLLGIESVDSQRGGKVVPGGQGAAMHAANASAVAMELSRIIVLENDVADVGIEAVLDLLGHVLAIDSEDVFRVSDLNNGVRVELTLEGIRVIALIDPLDSKEPLLDITDVVLFGLGVRHLEVVHSLL